ncbi:hypothetical protein F4859DRAFT_525168 [Xylaria cf. heliscus]|nr:hypothetical protein F4859DRAFT_525168 [Xylaria cf. heliscus]
MSSDFDFNTPLPLTHNGSNVEEAIKNDYGFNVLSPRHGDGVSTENSTPFIIDISESEREDDCSPLPAKATFSSQETLLPVNRGGVEDAMKDSFEFNAQLSPHGDVNYLGSCVAVGQGHVPVNTGMAESEENVYSTIHAPPSAKAAIDGQDTPLFVRGGDVENTMEASSGHDTPCPSYTGVEDGTLPPNQHCDIPPTSTDTVVFEKDVCVLEPEKTASTGRDTPPAERARFDEVTGPLVDDDVVMMDAEDLPTVRASNVITNDILGSMLRENPTIIGDEHKQGPTTLDGSGDFSLPPWMAGFLEPDLLHNLMVYNLKKITFESDKIHFTFV